MQPDHWLIWLIGLGVVMGAVVNLVRNNLVNYFLTIIIILAVIAAIILLVEFWEWFLGLLLTGLIILLSGEICWNSVANPIPIWTDEK